MISILVISGSSDGGGHAQITALPKTQEQINEEKRKYLRERKNYD
jgi:hypothetical protein